VAMTTKIADRDRCLLELEHVVPVSTM